MHISVQSIKSVLSKSQIDTLNCTLEELAIIKAIQDNPHITQESLRSTIHKSIATVKRLTVALQEKGILERKKGKSNGEQVDNGLTRLLLLTFSEYFLSSNCIVFLSPIMNLSRNFL